MQCHWKHAPLKSASSLNVKWMRQLKVVVLVLVLKKMIILGFNLKSIVI